MTDTHPMRDCYSDYLEYYPWKKSEYPDYGLWLTSDADDARIFRQGWAANGRERNQLKAINAECLNALIPIADANEQAALNSPQYADWSNGVATGIRVAIDTLTGMLKVAGAREDQP